jgi:hypothetical protein
MMLARYYQLLLNSGQFENRAALARYLGISRARVTQVCGGSSRVHDCLRHGTSKWILPELHVAV